jgi:hypothetical protein
MEKREVKVKGKGRTEGKEMGEKKVRERGE